MTWPKAKWLLLMVFLFGCSAGLHWLDRQIARAAFQKELVDDIELHGGEIIDQDEDELALVENDLGEPRPFTRAWVEAEFGNEYFREIAAIRYPVVRRNQFHTTTSLEPLRRCPALQKLEIFSPRVRDDSLAVLGALPELRTLSLSLTRITNQGLVHLRGLSQLETLDLSATNINDEGLTHLEELKSLREVNLSFTDVTPSGVAYLKTVLRPARVEHNGLMRSRYDEQPSIQPESFEVEDNPFQ
jgi:hypothetical protein